MNRRHFLGGALAVLGVGAFKAAVTPSAADTPVLTQAPVLDCLIPPELLDRSEYLINQIRSHLNANNLLTVPTSIIDFYDAIVSEYVKTFGEDGTNWDELDDAAQILNDPACFVADAPEQGCEFYEAWKFFRHQEGLALYPADGSVPYRSLAPAEQVRVAEATTAYVGLLQNIFGSLMTQHGLNTDDFNTMNSQLFVYSASMSEIRFAAVACGIPDPQQPAPQRTIMAQPAPMV